MMPKVCGSKEKKNSHRKCVDTVRPCCYEHDHFADYYYCQCEEPGTVSRIAGKEKYNVERYYPPIQSR